MFEVDIAPNVTMYRLLESLGYSPSFALCEFIDNALHAHAKAKISQPLNVSLRFYSDGGGGAAKKRSIEVSDDGPGMSKDKLIDALKPAKPPQEVGLSEFGIGMKAASIWFTEQWVLTTKPAEENCRYRLAFNLPEVLISGKEKIMAEEEESTDPSGTSISLKNLRQPITQEKFQAVCQDLKEIYQKFTQGDEPQLKLEACIDDGDVKNLRYDNLIKFLNKPKYKKKGGKLFAVGDDREWKTEIAMDFGELKVTGFFGVLEEGSYKTNPGLRIFRYSRLIQGLSTKPYTPELIFQTKNKYGAQRLYGELTVDGFPVTYMKDQLKIDEEQFAKTLLIQPGVKEIVEQATNYRVRENPIAVGDEAEVNALLAEEKGKRRASPPEGSSSTSNPTSPNTTGDEQKPGATTGPLTIGGDSGEESKNLAATAAQPEVSRFIKPNILQADLSTSPYCLKLIFQMNWVYANKNKKDKFAEIIASASRQLLENHLDFTYSKAFPSGGETKFPDQLNAMQKLLESNSWLSGLHQSIKVNLSESCKGFQTFKNICSQLSNSETVGLIGALHLMAHKGTQHQNFDNFCETYGIKFNQLLEILTCIANYQYLINTKSANTN